MAKIVAPGETAPDFTLPDQDGKSTSLHDLWKSGPVVLYFYPKDETRGCTLEACAFRDSYQVFTDAGASVVGVSSDGVEAHRKFADHHRLPFTLLADRGGRVRAIYGVPKTLGIIEGRVTFVIDGTGVVRHVYSSQLLATRHIDEALAIVKQLRGTA